ncbi:hypothetical protein WA026_021994 [Henosepilachna vigintioctopunctata]|uniref:CRAL-TRIO domain-containing protein n=1 Tax=Henosepilachna vigintioctopunctata TaxID=420089 RepID=A0AAW1VJ76_9CUCU
MSQLSKLMQVTEDQKKMILKEHNMTEEDFQNSVEVLKTWLVQNENFSENAAHENMLKVALLNCKMSVEKAKRTYEGYLTVKTQYADFFEKLIPNEEFKKIADLSINIIMPKLLPDLCRLHISKITDSFGEAADGLDYYIMPLMIAQLRILNDFFLSNEILIDMENISLKVLLKFTPSVNYKLVHLLSAVNLRVHHIHIINAPPIYDKIFFLLKSFLPAKFVDKVLNHASLEELHKHVPKDYLPSDYGGTEKSMKEMQELWSKELEANDSVLRDFRNLKVKSITQHSRQILDDMGMGVEGSFKTLTID